MPSKELTDDLVRFLSAKGITFYTGKICSTDAPFRETISLIGHLRLQKVIAIEIEIAAVFAVASFRKIKAAAVVVVSDELKEDQWSRFQPDYFSEVFVSSFNHLVDFFS